MKERAPEKLEEKLALFRFGLIAPVLNEDGRGQNRYFKRMSEKQHVLPDGTTRTFGWSTFKTWLAAYRARGIDGLRPKPRNDRGRTRKIDSYLTEIIKEMKHAYPFLSSSGIYRMLISEGFVMPGAFSEQTLRKFLQDNKLSSLPQQEPKPRKKFEKEHINELWIIDFMYGPFLATEKGKKKRSYLVAVIDDHSRLITGHYWSFQESTLSLEMALKRAIMRCGPPDAIYTDNGAPFVTRHLHLICARLGIALIHSTPHDPPGRGKIERFFKTTQEQWLVLMKAEEISLEELSNSFDHWLNNEYHKRFHTGINMSPLERYTEGLNHRGIRHISQEELDNAFCQTLVRLVKNDSTISIHNHLYEVPSRFIGQRVEVRYPTAEPHKVTLWEHGKLLCSLNKIDVNENANFHVSSIRFSQQREGQGQ